ncbi:MAG TPA: peptide chain release factor 1 [Verrucomicrobiota bacterium]|nr:peptide chain release factor 1 [Verrucomicrobiales bacterium]HRI16685.1 peptide chain release factor 1 [Verrucomicrobiota bacterium]
MDFHPFIARFRQRFAEVESQLSAPDAFAQPQRGQELTREHARLRELVESGDRFIRAETELAENRALLAAEPTGSELAQLAADEVKRLEADEVRLADRLRAGILPPSPTDSRNSILELRAAAGGAESALFAADLLRLYQRYAEAQGWKFEVLDASPSDLGGYKDAVISVTGPDVYKRLKYESGVHRVQRVPATEAQGRVHTSTVTVAVMPEAEEVDVVIKPEDLEINVCRASGHGGQGVNTTDSAVRIFHKPSGIEVRCQDGRSQQKNKQQALTVLRSRLLERKMSEENAKYAAERKSQVGTGERSEKSRTYNFPQNRVTDHRIDLTLYNLSAVMEGDLDPLIEPLMADDLKRRLAELHV